MKKIILLFCLLSILYTAYSILPKTVLAQDAPNTNVTKRRPDRPANYSPSPAAVGAGLLPPVKPEVKQVETPTSSFFAKMWAWLKSFFTN
jgi:hypothetical protein